MAAGTAPIFYDTPKTAAVQIAAADTTTLKTLLTAGADGALVLGVEVVTDDTTANDVGLYVQIGGSGTNYPLGAKRAAARSGDPTQANPTPSVALLDAGQMPFLLPDGTLQLGPGDIVKVGVQATVTAAKTVTVFASYGDY
jgi:hypothetical protein